MISQLQKQINHIKKETNTAILAHSYQNEEILEVADYVGDSFKLSLLAASAKEQNLLLCGVHFMAETAKILSPNKRVFLANSEAGCPMAEQMTVEELLKAKEADPDRAVVCYINTTAELKKHCDVCVTSVSAVKIVRNMKADKILFIPDINLGSYVQEMVPEKDIQLYNGGCPYHAAVTIDDVNRARAAHPKAKLLVHPECPPEVVAAADVVGSTSEIIDFAKSARKREFIIGTEISIVNHLSLCCPDKRFYPLSKKLICPDMKVTTLADVHHTLTSIYNKTDTAFEIKMSDDDIKKAKRCIDQMLQLGR